jgi:hypothetical protein
MKDRIRKHLLDDHRRFVAKGLFGEPGDSFSMRIPGLEEFLLIRDDGNEPMLVAMISPGDELAALHTRLYRARPDAGALLIGATPWSAALAGLGETIPVLFDEQARHIGTVRAPVNAGDSDALERAVGNGANAAIIGTRRLCLGVTPERIVFNAEMFEKCAKAYVIARASGRPVRPIPWWVRQIAARRLGKDQLRASETLAAGRIPEGMNAY